MAVLAFKLGMIPAIAATAVAAAALVATIIRLIATYDDRRAMISAEREGMKIHPVTSRLVLGSIRREWLRVIKTILLLLVIATVPGNPIRNRIAPVACPWLDVCRAQALAVVAVGLLINSVWDQIDQRFALRWRGIIPQKLKPEKV